jgi:hypothetical protein
MSVAGNQRNHSGILCVLPAKADMNRCESEVCKGSKAVIATRKLLMFAFPLKAAIRSRGQHVR